jgi:hypothetical protein
MVFMDLILFQKDSTYDHLNGSCRRRSSETNQVNSGSDGSSIHAEGVIAGFSNAGI